METLGPCKCLFRESLRNEGCSTCGGGVCHARCLMKCSKLCAESPMRRRIMSAKEGFGEPIQVNGYSSNVFAFGFMGSILLCLYLCWADSPHSAPIQNSKQTTNGALSARLRTFYTFCFGAGLCSRLCFTERMPLPTMLQCRSCLTPSWVYGLCMRSAQ